MARGVTAPKSSPDQIARRALAALEAGQEEVLADELSRELKRGLSAPHAAYLGEAPATVA